MIKDYVKLRQRERKGVVSLYLDIYYKGKRKQESLKLYLVPELNREDKRKNKETLAIAEGVCAERLLQIKNHIFNLDEESCVLFFDFFSALANKKETEGCKGNWLSALRVLHQYEKKNIHIKDIDRKWCEGFKDFLNEATTAKNTIHPKVFSANTKCSYFRKLKAALKQAVQLGYINKDPSIGVESPKEEQSTRCFLTLDELKKMTEVKDINPIVRRPFLFSCLTGLRCSDISKMKWSEVSEVNGMTRITFHQQKTNNLQYLDINAQAAELLGERGASGDLVFPVMMSNEHLNLSIRSWALKAGIDKHLTFHSGRHTFATLMLTLGTDIYTVSKLLGHTDVKTTQIYAKIIDEKRQEAVNKIPEINI